MGFKVGALLYAPFGDAYGKLEDPLASLVSRSLHFYSRRAPKESTYGCIHREVTNYVQYTH